MKFIDLTGIQFGRLTVIKRADSKKRLTLWQCLCACGNTSLVPGGNLRNGHTKSCGCFLEERRVEANTKHGHCVGGVVSKTNACWQSMIARCNNKNDNSYHRYGGRGIKVCDKWLNFSGFLEDMGEVPNGFTIDRKDNKLGYFKENCRWATKKEQARNTRKTIILTIDGETKAMTEWAEIYNIKAATVYHRLLRGILPIDALTMPLQKNQFR